MEGSVLKVKDEKTGKWIDVPAIQGGPGKSAYEQAVEGGYEGSEEDFIAILNTSFVRIKTGIYIGKGKVGADNCNRLTFDFKPQALFIDSVSMTGVAPLIVRSNDNFRLCDTTSSPATNRWNHVTWGDDYVEWHCSDADAQPYMQLNESPIRYYYVALG